MQQQERHSSYKLMRVMNVQYKTAWFTTHRIRKAMASGKLRSMSFKSVVVENNEPFIGCTPGTEVRRGSAKRMR